MSYPMPIDPFEIAKAHGEITGLLGKYTKSNHHREFVIALYAHIMLFEQLARRNGQYDVIDRLRRHAVSYRTVTGLAHEHTRKQFQSDNT